MCVSVSVCVPVGAAYSATAGCVAVLQQLRSFKFIIAGTMHPGLELFLSFHYRQGKYWANTWSNPDQVWALFACASRACKRDIARIEADFYDSLPHELN